MPYKRNMMFNSFHTEKKEQNIVQSTSYVLNKSLSTRKYMNQLHDSTFSSFFVSDVIIIIDFHCSSSLWSLMSLNGTWLYDDLVHDERVSSINDMGSMKQKVNNSINNNFFYIR
jgi:hypothetical protein